MSASAKSEAEKLFDLYSANLVAYLPTYPESFCCPICLRLFERSALPRKSYHGELSIEHIIPGALSGKITTLTCRECNNRGGAELDSHIVQRIRTEDALSGRSDNLIRGKIRIGEGEMTVDIQPTAKGISFYGIPKASNPAKVELLKAALNAGENDFSIDLHASLGFKPKNAQVAIVRMAYLAMFRHFGYGYIFHPALNHVREQIHQPNADLFASYAIVSLREQPPEPIVVSVLTSPHELQCFFVALDLSTGAERYFGVAMPGFNKSDDNIYATWQSHYDTLIGQEYSMEMISYHRDIICDARLKGYPAHLWKRLTQST